MSMYIMGVDPGSNHIGVAIFTLSNSGEIVSIVTRDITAEGIKSGVPFHKPIHYKLKFISDSFKEILAEFNPKLVCFESGFINPHRMNSIIPLTKALAVMELAVIELDSKPFMVYLAPQEAKRKIGADFKLGKDGVVQALTMIDEVFNHVDPHLVSEHVADAIMLGYVAVRDMLNNMGSFHVRHTPKW